MGVMLSKRAVVIFDRVVDVLVYIALALLVFSWLTVCADVVLRYFFSRPIPWSTEVTEYILLQITFLGTAWLLRREGHVIVDVVISRLSERNQSLLNSITSIIAALLCLAMTYWAVVDTLEVFQQGLIIPKQLDTPKYIVFIVIPLGYLMLSLQFMRRAYGFLAGVKTGEGKKFVMTTDRVSG